MDRRGGAPGHVAPEPPIAIRSPGAPPGAPGTDPAGDVVALTRALVDIPSPTGAEEACATYLRDWFRARGIEADLQPLGAGRANVVARVRGQQSGRTLLLAGHLDTSYAGDEALDYPGLGPTGPNERPAAWVEGGAVHGLGAFNMKGGLAAAAVALAGLAADGLAAGEVVFAGLAGESEKAPVLSPMVAFGGGRVTGRGFGARRFLADAGRIDAAVVAGPSDLRVVNAQAGSLLVEVAVCGRPAYLGRRAAGEAAPLEAAGALAGELAAWGRVRASARRMETGLGAIEPGLTVGAIAGGWPFAPATSPGACHLFVDLRTAPGESQAAAVRELRAVLAAFAARHRLSVRGRLHARGRGTLTPASDSLVRAAAGVLQEDLGRPAAPFLPGSADTTNDTNRFRDRAIPSIKLGPGATEPTPHVPIADLRAAARLYVRLAERLTPPADVPEEELSP